MIQNIPSNLMRKLMCPIKKDTKLYYNAQKKLLTTKDPSISYKVYKGIPDMITANGGPKAQDWNIWDSKEIQKMGDSYYKRAKGELPEKEASKSYARLLKNKKIYNEGDSLLDIGCATGHFLRSFRKILDPNIFYTGLDSHAPFLSWGSEIYGISENCNFVYGDAMKLPFKDNAFDITIVNLYHFFENIELALKESIRATKKYLIWRTPIGEINYIVKLIYEDSYKKLGTITHKRNDLEYSLYQLFSKKYIEGLIKHLGAKLVFIERDLDFEQFDNNLVEGFENVPATKTLGKLQINGNLILDWHYIAIDCS